MIKNKGKKASVVAVVAVLLTAGCMESSKETTVDTTKDMVKIMPEGVGYIMVIDLETIREEPNLKNFYDSLTKTPENFGFSYESMNMIGAGLSNSNKIQIALLQGKFEKEEINAITGACEGVEEYKDAEIWSECEDNYGRKSSKVIFSESLVLHYRAENQEYIKGIIDTINGEGKTAYGTDEDIKDIVDRLPENGGITTLVKEGYTNISDSTIIGFSLAKKSEETLELKMVLKFKTEGDAAEHGEEALTQMENGVISDPEISQDNEFVEITGTVPMEKLSEFMGSSL